MADKRYSVVVGDINGRLSGFFEKLSTLQIKQNFAIAIVAGDLFADAETATQAEADDVDKLLNGEIEVALPTYFAIGSRALPKPVIERLESGDGELCPNLTALGRRISIKTSEGFRIVALGGSHEANRSDDPMSPYDATYTDEDASILANDLNDADLLITSYWPTAILDGSRASYKGESPYESPCIADLCTALKPRYHFSTSKTFFEREPFFYNGPPPRSITRFLSLAPFGNTDKQKWIYAFSLEPSASPSQALPEGCTTSPFSSAKKRKLDSQQDSYNSFRFSNGHGGGDHYNSDRGRRKRQKHQPPPTPDQCFFCLSNQACETHMIGSIGTEAYLTVAKGPLTTRETFPDLKFPGHILIIPLQHS